jgi:hypothetical protein
VTTRGNAIPAHDVHVTVSAHDAAGTILDSQTGLGLGTPAVAAHGRGVFIVSLYRVKGVAIADFKLQVQFNVDRPG